MGQYFKSCIWGILIISVFINTNVYADKDLDFSPTSAYPCTSDIQQYEINYDNASSLEWIVEGGVIESLDGRNENWTPQEMFEEYMGSQWITDYTTGKNIPFTAKQTYSYLRIKFDGNTRMSATCYVAFQSGAKLFDGDDHLGPSVSLKNNPLKKITILWSPFATVRTIKCIAKGLGAIGFLTGKSGEVQKTIQLYKPIPSFNLTASTTNLKCTEGVQVNGVPYNTTFYNTNWNTSSGVVTSNWNTGVYIDHFNSYGVVPITVSVSNVCGESISSTVNITVSPPDFGHVTQNGNAVDVPGSVVTLDCQGNFYLAMPWVASTAVYTWELPSYYDLYTNTYTRKVISGNNMTNIQGQMSEGYTDFVGKVTITGVCGAAVVRTFIIRPTTKPTVDADIYSCTNSVLVNINNPNGNSPVNPYIVSSSSNGWALSWVNTPTSTLFTASKAGDYVIKINITDVSGCYVPLQTTVHVGSASGNTNTSTAGWQAGVLSDNRKVVGSNLAAFGGNIYFAGRDGKIYYYTFSTALAKWVINEIPGVTNALIAGANAFTKIGIATVNNIDYLFYTNTGGYIMKINLATNIVDDAFTSQTNSTDFIVTTNEIYALETGTNKLVNNQSLNLTIPNAILKTIIPGYGVAYIQNNNLYTTTLGQLTTSNDVYATTDVVSYNGYVYFTKGQKGVANLYRISLSSPATIQQITTTINLSSVFTINPATGVIYYGVLDLPAQNTIYAPSAGSYKAANIYQAKNTNGVWSFNKATSIPSLEGIDMYIHSPIYSGNHVYYVGAGRNPNTVGTNYKELEVWNLYYENGCAPAVLRTSAVLNEEEPSAEVLVYPNPFVAELILDLSVYTLSDGTPSSVDIEVYDAAGKRIHIGVYASEKIQLSTSGWASGLYVVKIKNKDRVVTKKVIKTN